MKFKKISKTSLLLIPLFIMIMVSIGAVYAFLTISIKEENIIHIRDKKMLTLKVVTTNSSELKDNYLVSQRIPDKFLKNNEKKVLNIEHILTLIGDLEKENSKFIVQKETIFSAEADKLGCNHHDNKTLTLVDFSINKNQYFSYKVFMQEDCMAAPDKEVTLTTIYTLLDEDGNEFNSGTPVKLQTIINEKTRA
ncbi:MAG: hypothetical protein Q8888_02060 [Vigna little leaf phytoplasma]|nr:hypothetical protein [Vigna little leaf phytoplasma]